MRKAGHVIFIGKMRSAKKIILGGIFQWKRAVKEPRRREKYSIKMDLTEIKCEDDWI
jgi:hypothetical protein